MYSQTDEEEHIVKYFEGVTGKFLDIGAYNGVTFSNTRRLAELGWSGTCVEPSIKPFWDLMNLYRENEKIVICNCVISDSDKLHFFFDGGGDAISSFDQSLCER